jgi:hypothetical protein
LVSRVSYWKTTMICEPNSLAIVSKNRKILKTFVLFYYFKISKKFQKNLIEIKIFNFNYFNWNEGDVVPSHSPNPNSLLTSSRSPSQTEGLTYSYASYIQPSYLCTSSSCDGYLLSKPLVSYESCYHPMINMNTTTYAQQMMAHISELANKSKILY